MRELTNQMIKDFKITKLGIDFMGYQVERKQDLSFHHLIIPHRNCKSMGLGEGYLYWNGSILESNSSHPYLHLLEQKDYDMFLAITSEMIDMNILGRLDIDNLRRIRDILEQFEREHCADRSTKGKLLIKREYIEKRVKL